MDSVAIEIIETAKKLNALIAKGIADGMTIAVGVERTGSNGRITNNTVTVDISNLVATTRENRLTDCG